MQTKTLTRLGFFTHVMPPLSQRLQPKVLTGALLVLIIDAPPIIVAVVMVTVKAINAHRSTEWSSPLAPCALSWCAWVQELLREECNNVWQRCLLCKERGILCIHDLLSARPSRRAANVLVQSACGVFVSRCKRSTNPRHARRYKEHLIRHNKQHRCIDYRNLS